MALATVEELKEIVGTSVSQSRLEGVLTVAQNVVSKKVPVNHPLFAYIQAYYSAWLLEGSGDVDGSVVTATKVGDVSVNFSSGGGKRGYWEMYSHLLREAQEKRGRTFIDNQR